ncbi:MAG: hypothetical protein V2A66_00875 [Pseudomonadota bacterium]
MKTPISFVLSLVAVIAAGQLFASEPPRDAPACVEKFTVSRGECPWAGIVSGYDEQEAAKTVRAERAPWGKLEVMKGLEKYRTGGEPLLAVDKERRVAVVNARYFSQLKRIDATSAMPGPGQLIGKVLRPGAIAPEKLAHFLLESQVIETYRHLEADLCLQREEKKEGVYTAFFSGVHKYCTNECHETPFKFFIRIDGKSGEMSVGSE